MSSGSQIQIAGYAKLAVLNGYPGVYGYLGQYFDQAYQIDANGNVTTNTTGVLSPYGNFFATEPGPAALVTMPDVDTGERGICTVNCFSEVLDKNHNTNVLDTSFSVPNATSQASPLRWWINNDDDAPGVYGGLDHDIESPGMPPDYAFSDPIYGNGKTCVHSQRDLEDYTRLWICGVPALTNGGYQVTMSWANVSSGNPVVKLFQSVETNGGTLYLTDTNVAATQAAVQTYVLNTNMAYYIPGPGVSIGTVSNGATFTFPASYFTNSGNKYLLFEGAGIGAGELVMTISQNGNAIAQTGVWLDLHDVRDFYERAVITNNMSGALSNWTSGIEMVQPATASALGDDQDLYRLDSRHQCASYGLPATGRHGVQAAVLGGLSREICHGQMALQPAHPHSATARSGLFQPERNASLQGQHGTDQLSGATARPGSPATACISSCIARATPS